MIRILSILMESSKMYLTKKNLKSSENTYGWNFVYMLNVTVIDTLEIYLKEKY